MIKINNYLIVPTIFPDNTSQVWDIPVHILESRTRNVIYNLENADEIEKRENF
jgi:hypothetical protein